MRLRSLLFVPGDRPERMEKALKVGADALILDLEDSVALEAKPQARASVNMFLKSAPRSVKLFVRVNPLGSDLIDDDLAAVLDTPPNGLVLPKAEGAESIEALATRCHSIPILPIVTETPSAIFKIGSYAGVEKQLLGLTWGAEDLPSAIGASTARDEHGRYLPPYELVRSLTLFGAHAANVPAIETVYPSFRDLEGLRTYARNGRRDGFTGMMAIHPDQVPIINEAFSPSDEEVAHAKAVIAAFEANPGKGALQLDGRMIDLPHLKLARRLMRFVAEQE